MIPLPQMLDQRRADEAAAARDRDMEVGAFALEG
jgi:hypothetical protein